MVAIKLLPTVGIMRQPGLSLLTQLSTQPPHHNTQCWAHSVCLLYFRAEFLALIFLQGTTVQALIGLDPIADLAFGIAQVYKSNTLSLGYLTFDAL